MSIPRTVYARLIERFIFNFRVRPEVLAVHVPVSYLHPQLLNGWSVVSFCILRLDRIMLAPVPSCLGLRSISCAYRCGVLDTSGPQPEPSVYIPERYTDRALISQLGPWVFSGSMSRVCSSLTREGATTTIRVHYPDRRCLFSASLQPSASADELNSVVFDSLESFARFINLGVSSYTPACYGDALARVDLHKEDTHYEAFQASIVHNSLDDLWPDAQLVFDSAVRATGGPYRWMYRGLVERNSCPC